MSEYEQVVDGKWFNLPTKWDLACCDCGLVHKVEARLKHGQLQIRMTRHGPATGGRRKALFADKSG